MPMPKFRIRDNRKPVNIRVALDTILYAPLYTFVQRNSIDSDCEFRFHVRPVRSPIKLKRSIELNALAPIESDPVFTGVIEKIYFKTEIHKHDWFGIGDPLRIRRMIQYGGEYDYSYDFVGTLIDKLAFWVVSEGGGEFQELMLSQYNYVACQSFGMTGYYLAESLFKTKENNPLAPSNNPGQEVDHVFNLLNLDFRRRARIDDDPVRFAAVSTEIDRILYWRNKLDHVRKINSYRVDLAFKDNEKRKVEPDYLLTAIVARRYDNDEQKQQEVERAKTCLVKGIKDEIKLLASTDAMDRSAFLKNLTDFYWSRVSFDLPGGTNLFRLLRLGRDLENVLDSLKDNYPKDLIASAKAKKETDNLLWKAIQSELNRNGHSNSDSRRKQTEDNPEENAKVELHFNKLRTDTWGAKHNQLWR